MIRSLSPAPLALPAATPPVNAAAPAADIQQLRDVESQKLRKEPASNHAASSAGKELINELKERQILREQRMAARAAGAQER
ncbi:hypothetical protein VK98_05680 [Chromobacterium sp. LK11]|uniref:hypothetical protein n=1 Tax=Chromobacterium sp. LK11 TaxID=1628212 RepID=UPI00065434C0|nr:hypothetical protein [Chromobacterium sp. LK11]KMN82986.1 hypothetical protein VK98_05680 [Chromobacterium sp. LK11]